MERKPRPNNPFHRWGRMSRGQTRAMMANGSIGAIESFTFIHSAVLASELIGAPTPYAGHLIKGEIGVLDCGFTFKESK